MTTTAPDDIDVREGTYGDRVVAVEPGGAEFIPLSERHGRPIQLFWTWTSPNMEFATIFVGLLGVWGLGLSFWSTVVAIGVGTALGATTHAILSTLGPTYGVPQMVLSRRGFGYWGNILPAGLNSLAGAGDRLHREQPRRVHRHRYGNRAGAPTVRGAVAHHVPAADDDVPVRLHDHRIDERGRGEAERRHARAAQARLQAAVGPQLQESRLPEE